jgi:hypothetical protein
MRLKTQIPLSAAKEMADMLEARGAVMEARDLSHDQTQVCAHSCARFCVLGGLPEEAVPCWPKCGLY